MRYVLNAIFGGSAFAPGSVEYLLGAIARNGSTFQIPYLTVYPGYNQRIVIRNRGDSEAHYEMEFKSEDAISAVSLLEGDETIAADTTLMIKAVDVVETTGGYRTAATLTVEGEPENVDVSTVIVNMDGGGTDSVVYQACCLLPDDID